MVLPFLVGAREKPERGSVFENAIDFCGYVCYNEG